jgi:hypothetical protein
MRLEDPFPLDMDQILLSETEHTIFDGYLS